jgi:hypothetical protein
MRNSRRNRPCNWQRQHGTRRIRQILARRSRHAEELWTLQRLRRHRFCQRSQRRELRRRDLLHNRL